MSKAQEQNEEQVERRSSKARTALEWIGLLALAVFPFPWWP
jgi:hypothetical protein